jgi:hypothetical protein
MQESTGAGTLLAAVMAAGAKNSEKSLAHPAFSHVSQPATRSAGSASLNNRQDTPPSHRVTPGFPQGPSGDDHRSDQSFMLPTPTSSAAQPQCKCC